MEGNAANNLFNDNQNLVYYLVNTYFRNGYYTSDYEDLIQEGMLGLWTACNKYEETRVNKFSSFASICILNSIRMYKRSNKKHLGVYSTDDIIKDTEGVSLLDSISDISLEGCYDDILDRISAINALKTANLSDLDKSILYMEYYEENTQREIADILNLKQSTVSKHIKSALNKIRKTI